MLCEKGHWRLETHDYDREKMRKAFETAKKCKDYQEEA
jgi:hypothetical protein